MSTTRRRREYPLQVQYIEGASGCAYFTKGHHDPRGFLAELIDRTEIALTDRRFIPRPPGFWDVLQWLSGTHYFEGEACYIDAPVRFVVQTYARWACEGPERYLWVGVQPGCGAFPVTMTPEPAWGVPAAVDRP